MKKVLFLIHDLGGGGAEKVLVNLVNRLGDDGYNITLISLFGGGVNEKKLNKKINYRSIFKHTFPGNSHLFKLFSPKTLHRWIVKEKYDIEVSYLEGPSARIISGCMNDESKKLCWIHIQQRSMKIASKSFRNYHEALNCYKGFDQIACVSDSVQKDFLSIFPELTNTYIVPNIVELSDIKNIKCGKQILSTESPGCFKLIGIGKLLSSKGFDKLIRITGKLRKAGLDIETWILGEGKERDSLLRLARDENIDRYIHLVGYVQNPYLYLSQSDLFVCCSSSEGYSTAATEAMILGIPIVTTPVAGSYELLGSLSKIGIAEDFSLKALEEKIAHLLNNQEAYRQYKTLTQHESKKFNSTELYKRNLLFLNK